jgi:hypothetical protein
VAAVAVAVAGVPRPRSVEEFDLVSGLDPYTQRVHSEIIRKTVRMCGAGAERGRG